MPPLRATLICEERQSSKVPGNWFNSGGKERQKNRAKTFPGIAKAMADQWGGEAELTFDRINKEKEEER